MSQLRRIRRIALWFLIRVSGFVLVLIAINANARYERDPSRDLIDPGRPVAITIEPDEHLAIYIQSSAFFDFDVSPSDRYCSSGSPDMGISVASGLIRYAHVDSKANYMRIAYLVPSGPGTYELECIEYQQRRYFVAAAEPGSRIGRVFAAGIVNAGWLLLLGVPLVALCRTIRWIYHNYNAPSKLGSGWPGS